MELDETIKKRRSIRNFINKQVPEEYVNKLIKAATHAPSACNVQGWKFIVINNQTIKEKIVASGGSVLIKKAPIGILVIYDNQTKNTEYHDHIQSASAAIQNLNLRATDLGLGTCWICHLPSKNKLRKILNIPVNYDPIAYILVGFPERKPNDKPRKYSIEEVMNYNNYSPSWSLTKTSSSKLLIKKILIKIYYITPTFIKKSFLNKFIDKNFTKKFDN